MAKKQANNEAGNALGEWIRATRMEQGLSQRELRDPRHPELLLRVRHRAWSWRASQRRNPRQAGLSSWARPGST